MVKPQLANKGAILYTQTPDYARHETGKIKKGAGRLLFHKAVIKTQFLKTDKSLHDKARYKYGLQRARLVTDFSAKTVVGCSQVN
jgi:hypothetical protein